MRVFTLFLVAVILLLTTVEEPKAQYYYSGERRIPLTVDSTRLLLKFDVNLSTIERENLLNSVNRIVKQIPDDRVIDGFVTCSLSAGTAYNTLVGAVKEINGIYLAEPYYRLGNNSAMLVGETFVVAYDNSLSRRQIDEINMSFGVVVDRELPQMPNVYVLRNTDSSGYRLLDLANTFHKMSATRFAHPDFSAGPMKFSPYNLYDYYNSFQFHTKKIIGSFNEASVWDFAGLDDPGDTIWVAVIDDGVTSHEDLPASRILQGYDYNANDTAGRDDDPSPGYEQAHGMGCAGIIGASHSTNPGAAQDPSTGIISLNTHVRILPVKIFNDDGVAGEIQASDIAEAINWAWYMGAEVLSNSWGYDNPAISFEVLDSALLLATQYGRGGLGCPVIFSSGNSADCEWQWCDFDDVGYPANLPYVIAVGAVDLDDERYSYSQYGDDLDLVAPSGEAGHYGDVWTLDQMLSAGYNPNYDDPNPKYTIVWECGFSVFNDKDYDCRFGGTSAACPIVSGTASLILSRDNTLTVDTVYSILRHSAITDLDSGPLETVPDTAYGYGRVDAFRAILSIARGDVDNNGIIDPGDYTKLIDYLFISFTEPFPDVLLADCDCNGIVDIGDISHLIGYLYMSGPPPVTPCYNFGD